MFACRINAKLNREPPSTSITWSAAMACPVRHTCLMSHGR
jgi:hypothetical protein